MTHPLDVVSVATGNPLSDVIDSGDYDDDVMPAVKPLPPVSESVDADVHSTY